MKKWHWQKIGNDNSGVNYLGQIEVILMNLNFTQDWLCNEYEAAEFSEKWSLEYGASGVAVPNEER